MVNGNYILYGDRPASESEIVDDHVHSRTAERKTKRKTNRTANELQYSLNLAQLDNETDSVKYEKKIKEPKLLRYVPTTDIEEHFVTEKFETYDLKPTEEPPKRYSFTKNAKNPADGSINYAYSRSSSSCSSPNCNLPTISEHVEQYGTYRIRATQTTLTDEDIKNYETKLDKYFSRPREVKAFVTKGSHPDSLYRVPVGSSSSSIGKLVRVIRVLRWPAALFAICVALAIFIYFLMPDNLSTELDTVNATTWEENISRAQSHRNPVKPVRKPPEHNDNRTQRPAHTSGMETQEIDFYDPEQDKNIELTSTIDTVTQKTRNIPVPPVFPTHITPEIQYGNEKADTEKLRISKLLQNVDTKPEDSTLKPHITQNPEKPLAIYFKEGTSASTSTESIMRAEIDNEVTQFVSKQTTLAAQEAPSKTYATVNKEPYMYVRNVNTNSRQQFNIPKLYQEIQDYYHLSPIASDNRFTSGHSKLFGISIEDAEKMKSTTQNSLYNTRVSPTLPTWRDKIDSTTKNYPLNTYSDVPQCRSTSLALCRGVLPYDLAGSAIMVDGLEVTELLSSIEYLIATNCSDRVRQFFCALLEPECSPDPYKPKMPCFNFCRAVAESCEGTIPRELTSVFRCAQYPQGNCEGARAPCGPREVSCNDGLCVPRLWACDGVADCPTAEDEASCVACDRNEFRCSSGSCILKRWLCDGYLDCPNGEDETEILCDHARHSGAVVDGTGKALDLLAVVEDGSEPEEESAGSAPAPSIRRPNRVPEIFNRNESPQRTGEIDNSKELLVTSDSNSGIVRNITRRPSASRLTPYSWPMMHDDSRLASKINLTRRTKPKIQNRGAKNQEQNKQTTVAITDKSSGRNTYDDEVAMEDFFDNQKLQNTKSTANIKENSKVITTPPPTRLDKSIHHLERVINGVALLKKASAAPVETHEVADSSESKIDIMEKNEDSKRKMSSLVGSVSAHASPCPSGELRCVDGRCITLSQLCDGTIDCSDHADEDNCFT